MFLSDLSIKQPVLATMLAATLVVLGIYSYRELSVDLMPNVELPVLTVQTTYPGASPETVEREVTKRIEEALNTIPGLRHITSTTAEGLSLVVVEFELGVSITTAQQDAQAKINAIRTSFPTDMEEPVIQRLDFGSMPVISVAVESSAVDIKTLSSLSEKVLKKRLENVSGVGQVKLIGLARREVQIFVDRQKLKALGLTFAEVAGSLQRENLELPAGKLEQGKNEPLVRVTGKLRSVEELQSATGGPSILRMWRGSPMVSRSAPAPPYSMTARLWSWTLSNSRGRTRSKWPTVSGRSSTSSTLKCRLTFACV
jgi:HAE1 family hydrophobic/amphiphilic exporter-1